MKFKCFIVCILLGFVSLGRTQECDNPFEVSNCSVESATVSTNRMPLAVNYRFNYCEVMLTYADLLEMGTRPIEYLAFLPTTVADGGLLSENCTIYMANTTRSLFGGLIQNADNDFEMVYHGELNVTEEGEWRVVQLDHPFRWDGSSNVVIAINRRSANFGTACYFAAYRNMGTLVKARYVCNDDTPYILGSISESSIASADIPYYRLLSCTDSLVDTTARDTLPCYPVASLSARAEDVNSIRVEWYGSAPSYDLAYRSPESSSPEADHYEYGITDCSYLINNATQKGEYSIFVRSHCQQDRYSDWERVSVAMHVGLEDVEQRIFSVYPNPASNYITLQLPDEIQECLVVLTDMAGREVFKNRFMTDSSGNLILPLDNITSGTYQLVCYTANNRLTKQLVIE